MGQYHKVYNIDKKQMISGHGLNNGLKLMEQIGFEKSTSSALFLLLSNSPDGSGGDPNPHEMIGSWAGDRIVIQGDYADENSKSFISDTDDYENISSQVMDMLNVVFAYDD